MWEGGDTPSSILPPSHSTFPSDTLAFDDPVKEARFRTQVDVAVYKREAQQLRAFLEARYGTGDRPKHIAFCHNDLIPRNCIYPDLLIQSKLSYLF